MLLARLASASVLSVLPSDSKDRVVEFAPPAAIGRPYGSRLSVISRAAKLNSSSVSRSINRSTISSWSDDVSELTPRRVNSSARIATMMALTVNSASGLKNSIVIEMQSRRVVDAKRQPWAMARNAHRYNYGAAV